MKKKNDHAVNYDTTIKFISLDKLCAKIVLKTYHSDGVDRVNDCEQENVVWFIIVFSGKKRNKNIITCDLVSHVFHLSLKTNNATAIFPYDKLAE